MRIFFIAHTLGKTMLYMSVLDVEMRSIVNIQYFDVVVRMRFVSVISEMGVFCIGLLKVIIDSLLDSKFMVGGDHALRFY